MGRAPLVRAAPYLSSAANPLQLGRHVVIKGSVVRIIKIS